MSNGRVLVALAALSVVVAACSPSTATEATTTTTAPETTTSSPQTTTSSPQITTTTFATTTSTDLPGEVIDFGPVAGDILMVVGVAYDDILNLRAAPGPTQDILNTIPPTYMGLIAQGETREIPGAWWIKVDYEGTIGWVHLGFTAYEGDTYDGTSQVVEDLGEYPTAETMLELGLIVAESKASPEDPKSDIVVVVNESLGDLGEVTYDVIGLGDDATVGFRLHVFGEPVSDGFSLKAVEVTSLCGRGVHEGLCV